MLTKLVQVAVRRHLCRSMSVTRPEIDPVQESLLEEPCILVDENDKVIGAASKRDCHAVQPGGKLLLHRAFSLFLFNSQNELLVQKRSPYKVTYPNCYTNTCCSHPLASVAGESEERDGLGVRLAAQRRLEHELGIQPKDALPQSMHYITRIHYEDKGDGVWGEHELDYMLFMKADVEVNPNPNEISEIKYVALDKMDEFLADLNSPLTPWFRLCQNKLRYWWENIDQLEKVTDHKNIIRF